MSQIVCRRPAPNETETVCALFTRIVTTSFPMFPDEAVKAYLGAWTMEKIKARLETGRDVLIAAYSNGEMIGLTSGSEPEGGVGTMVWLMVDARWRGHKAGRALYEAACAAYRAMGAHKMKLTVPSDEARRFYEHCGMEVEGFHPNHWYHANFTGMGVAL